MIEDRNVPLSLAIQLGDVDMANALVAGGANVNQTDRYGNTPLHLAVQLGNLEMVNALIARGANVNQTDRYGNTPLHLAVQLGNLEMVNALIARGADVNKVDKCGSTPLHFAAQIGNAEIINALIAHEVGDDRCTPLHLAVLRNDMELVNSLIELGANVCQESRGGYIPLHLAARAGNVEMINALIERGAKINQMNDDRFTPLHFAVQVGDVEVVNILLARGASVHRVDKYGFTPLHFATQVSNAEVIRALIERGADVNQTNSDKYVCGNSCRYANRNTPLHLAIERGNLEAVNCLLAEGADINQTDRYGFTPLHLAVQAGDVEVVNALVGRGADVNKVYKRGSTPLHFATQIGSNAEIINALIAHEVGDDRCTPLHLAVLRNDMELVNSLIERGADVNKANKYGFTPLHLAIERGNFEAVNALISHQVGDDDRCTPLHLAVLRNDMELVNSLIERGADVDEVSRDRYTPLHLAVRSNNIRMVNTLIKLGANVNRINRDGYTPLHLAVQVGDVELINALIKGSADINRVSRRGHTVLHSAIKSYSIQVVNALIKQGADVNKANKYGFTPLHFVIERGDFEIVNALIERGADVNRVGRRGHTVLHWAIRQDNIQVVNALIKQGADVNRVGRRGHTVLHWAVKNNNIQAVNTLIERGADIKMDIGYPLNWAIYYGFQDIAELLIQHEVKLKGCNVRKPRYLVQHNSDLEREMSEYIDRCVNEIEGMKKEIINGNVTFYDILTGKNDELASHVRKAKGLEDDYKSKFPTYSKAIESQYEIGKENLHLFNRALEAISNLSGVKNLPLEISEIIVKYLPSSFNRKSLIEAVEVKGLPNEKVIERRSSLEHKTIPTTQTVQDILTQIRGILDNQQIEVSDLLTLEFATRNGHYDYWLQQIDIAHAGRLRYQLHTEGNHTFEVAKRNDGNKHIVRVLNQFRENEEQQRLTLIITLNNTHWVTLVIERQNGNYVGYYADSTATAVPDDITYIIQNNLGNNIRINNVSVHQQTDGWNCGLWALENASDINQVLNKNPVGQVQNIINTIRDFLGRGNPNRDRNYFQNIRVSISQLFRNVSGFQNVQLQAYIQNREQIDPLLRTYLELGYHRVGVGCGPVEAPISLSVSDSSNFGGLPQSSLEGPEASRVSDLSKGKGGR